MATPDPEGVSLLAKVITAGGAVLAPVIGAVIWIENRYAKKHSVNNQINTVTLAIEERRKIEAKLFDELAAHARRDEALFREVIKTMGDHHAEVMKAIGEKADR